MVRAIVAQGMKSSAKSNGWNSAKLPPIPSLSIKSIDIQVFISYSSHIGIPLALRIELPTIKVAATV